MKLIALQGKHGEGKHVLVDDSDFLMLSEHKWYLGTHGYAMTTKHLSGNKKIGVVQKSMSMHRLIMGLDGPRVDHRDRNRLNNQRGNLRHVTALQNVWNNGKQVGESGYLGVRKESENCFSARLGQVTIGYYSTAVMAAQAHDIEAVKVRGEFARLNFNIADLPAYVEPLPARNVGERTSSIVGVSFAKNRKAKAKWRAVWRKKHIGWFMSEEEAIKALKEVKSES